jgi:Tol biopolymer transport system component
VYPQTHASSARVLLRLGLPLALAATSLLLGLGLVAAQGPTRLTRITNSSDPSSRYSEDASLSDDGTRIAFTSDSDFLGQGILDDQWVIWLHDTATMTFTRVTSGVRDSTRPAVSGDGTRVAFHSDNDFLGQGIPQYQYEIWLYDTATMTVTRVTTAAGPGHRASFGASADADGARVAFQSDSDFLGQGIPDDQLEIWLYDTATMTVTRVTTAAGTDRDSRSPSISADGTKIAFHSNGDFLSQGIPANQSEIWLCDTAAMTVTRITTASHPDRDSSNPSISGDGTRIAFRSDSDFLGQGADDDEVWLYDTATMTVTRITTASPPGRGSYNASISGDGTRIAFESGSDFLGQGIPQNQYEIWLYDTATMTVTRVTTASAEDRDSEDPSLNRDGSKIAFASDSDFLSQGIQPGQDEIWLREYPRRLYLPVVLRSGS